MYFDLPAENSILLDPIIPKLNTENNRAILNKMEAFNKY